MAIAFDAATDGGNNGGTGTTLSWSIAHPLSHPYDPPSNVQPSTRTAASPVGCSPSSGALLAAVDNAADIVMAAEDDPYRETDDLTPEEAAERILSIIGD